ncbi:uncharacterized protein LACBIDRAFT_303595 [Laccaria bicolor S238N-H82]|uniref:Predicted protein n=1 Tax=Laccaria bicolor (strain S238N-H82 / ATCC MYA-4686) TaxID=486041 RepID=B0DJT4_LACBS|nr:uncharacterized protein LACBIDRAFT_303595 [Laccaria bicolor S238N-H82]EDR05264.1 predicted protein [Laccaria bicolor S238N-H82]|eukprot:XP_001884229.1 predicted protein [Laccaria bicolor S238N-H82]
MQYHKFKSETSVFFALDSSCQSREWESRRPLRVIATVLECCTKIPVHQLSYRPVDRGSSVTPQDSSPPTPSPVSPSLTLPVLHFWR